MACRESTRRLMRSSSVLQDVRPPEGAAGILRGSTDRVGFNIERIVFTYLDYLLAAKGAGPDLAADPNFTFVYRNSVEHFFPQHANRDDDGWDLVDA